MPELPEVENVRRTLAPHILNKKIQSVEVYIDRMIKHPTTEEFIAGITGLQIKNLARRGKYLIFELDKKKQLVVHLRMTGALIFTPDNEKPPYARIRFELNDKSNLWYTDVRTLGTLHLLNEGENIIKGLSNLGPEPLKEDLTFSYLEKTIEKRHASIKGVLLDQAIIAGLGNIYVDEALAMSGILPKKKASELNKVEVKKLYDAIIKVIAQGIENRGTSFRDYKDGDGNKGSNQEHLLVYGRKNKPCHKCGTAIQYLKVAGRGTCFCPNCQK